MGEDINNFAVLSISIFRSFVICWRRESRLGEAVINGVGKSVNSESSESSEYAENHSPTANPTAPKTAAASIYRNAFFIFACKNTKKL